MTPDIVALIVQLNQATADLEFQRIEVERTIVATAKLASQPLPYIPKQPPASPASASNCRIVAVPHVYLRTCYDGITGEHYGCYKEGVAPAVQCGNGKPQEYQSSVAPERVARAIDRTPFVEPNFITWGGV